MDHLTELQFSMLADNALAADEAQLVESHLAECPDCRLRADQFRAESQQMRASLKTGDELELPATMPAMPGRMRLRDFAMANIATGVVIWLAQFLWKTIFGELVVNALTRLTAIYIPDTYELAVDVAMFFFEEGTTMIESYLGLVLAGLAGVTVTWLAVHYRRSQLTLGMTATFLLAIALVFPAPAEALDFRRSEGVVTIPEDVTIDDTLIVAAETVIIDGRVTGDVLAASRRVVVNGSVGGNLAAFAEDITIRGEVGGFAMSAGSSLEYDEATIGGDLWAAGDRITVDSESRVGRNATLASETATVDGQVAKDVFVFAERIEVDGRIGEDLEAFTRRVNLLNDAVIEGNVRFRSRDENNLERSPGATVNGEVEFIALPEQSRRQNRYLTGDYYLFQVFRLVSAFLVGVAVLWMIPALRETDLPGGVEGVKTAGVGLVTLISLPIVAIMLAATLVGIPFTFFGIVFWIGLIYFAKIVLAAYIGQIVLSGGSAEDSLPLTLLAGLAIIMIAINIPAIGGILNFVMIIVGIGMIMQLVMDYIAENRDRETV